MAEVSGGRHWEDYYHSGNVPALPSQFAVFALGECPADIIIDVGCGNGRDSLYFARRNIPTLGIDASEKAMAVCEAKAASEKLDHAVFMRSDVAAPDLAKRIREHVGETQRSVLLYSRFFLHAIDEQHQDAFFSLARALMKNRPGWIALEFRTPADAVRQKVTPDHYRRYVPMDGVLAASEGAGFVTLYSVEGRGMAKYKADDAYVGRVLARTEALR